MLKTRLTERFDLKHPVIQAPMATAAGGKLAGAVSAAGGFGLIGGGYGDPDWVARQFEAARNQHVGCGFITWSIRDKPALLETVLARAPKALFLSFADPAPLAQQIKEADVPLICQVQTLRDAKQALDVGADVIVAQGAEAGGHCEERGGFTLTPEIADHMARTHSPALLCAAGGIGDGRGLAAALMLGADGVVMGSRFWASEEALVHPNMHAEALRATGDDTIRTTIADRARKLNWPERYCAHVLKNAFTDRWHNNLEGLMAVAEEESARWQAAWTAGEMDTANTFVGEGAGLINSIKPAAVILEDVATEAAQQLRQNFF